MWATGCGAHRRAEHLVKLLGDGAVDTLRQRPINVCRRADGGVPEPLLDDLQGDSKLSEHMACRVAQAVERQPFQPGPTEGGVVNTPPEVRGADRSAVWRLDDQVLRIGSPGASQVGGQLVEDHAWHRDGSP